MKIIVVGYPRSGNTWLARLIGNVLQAPVTGVKKALPLAQEGLDRKSPHRVFQLHMRPHRGPCDHRQAIVSAASFCLDNWRDERVAFIVRDPRDVAVSAAAYWRQKLDVTVRRMADAKHPMPFGPWEKFVLAWADVQDDRLIRVRYEDLHADTAGVLARIMEWTGLDAIKPVQKVVAEESIEAKRKQIMRDGDKRPYGKDIQLHHLRKGIVGDWRNHDWTKIGPFADSTFAKGMDRLGYPREENWWLRS